MVTQASKVLLAGVAAAGAGYYLYEQRSGGGRLIDVSNYGQGPAEHAGRVVDNYASSGWNKVEDSKNSAGSWINDKGAQARQASDNVVDSAKESADIAAAKAAGVGGSVKSWFQDSRASAEKAYSDSWEKLDEAQKQFDDTKAAWWSWGAKQNEEAQSKAQENLDIAKKNYANSKSALSKWGQETIDSADKRLKDLKNSVKYNADKGVQQVNQVAGDAKAYGNKNLQNAKEAVDDAYESVKSKAQSAQDSAESRKNEIVKEYGKQTASEADLASRVRHSVEGWGETAQEVAQEEYDSLFSKKGSFFLSSEEASRKAKEYYDAKAKEAKKRYDETRGHWYSWGSSKSQDVQDEAKKQWEDLQAQSQSASDAVAEWSKKNSDKLVKDAQDGLDRAHGTSQGWLSGIRNWIRGN
ncbi:unnamed protein product [Kuraishia capsulata CBS 1993]|uniref:Uncharacterized protein n=1 Tax=Kuraishia capsulata CBS 1993 TaxID=1382522 RepID=W6MHK8_9ASCO|nr:uncharacterized protein KUCA_T00001446001 [Kuraishia capsulata CBS 1993]CDK25476.1 unnamed protein product [Kuraishia capsulata CBS 1993]